MVLSRIHVNQYHIKKNNKGADLPVITVKSGGQNLYGNTVEILDSHGEIAATVVYQRDKPLRCGARVWVETKNKVNVNEKSLSSDEIVKRSESEGVSTMPPSDEEELPDNWAEMSPYERVQWRMEKEGDRNKQLELKAKFAKYQIIQVSSRRYRIITHAATSVGSDSPIAYYQFATDETYSRLDAIAWVEKHQEYR
jgi:hypothetical protein